MTIDKLPEAILELKELAESISRDGLDEFASLELIQSIGFLSLALASATKADLLQTRALAESPLRFL